ncbi:hypothetical protein NCCP2222_33310 [Sporosarcina sp. NCCP-2222]|uniref:DUF4430 domain-containing protein n=1 Tax=Sporosarcina sp. NCCP-2222 TaxID=2935073 RepID=UPI00208C57FC|nr:DUF4430 domain-containing protein [Sporosarcina sp. NCCP-2222]GKV57384.1 hypothetical protein NCCP2222_33310 [Sporosarcina sp. NCCP-2222]
MYWRKISNIFLVVLLTIVLSACGSSLQKPTGLEDEEIQLTEDDPVSEEQTDRQEEEQNKPEKNGITDLEEPVEDIALEKTTETKLDSEKSSASNKDSGNKAVAEKKPAKTEKTAVDPSKATPAAPAKPSEKHNEKPLTKPSDKPTTKPAEKPVTQQQNTKPSVESPSTPETSKVVYSIVISSSEVPLPPTEMEIEEGDTVLDALIAITKKHKVQMDYRGGQGATAYIEGIANVYEFDRGQGSGWMYRVNGIFPDRGAGVIKLQDGDRVEWLYTTNLGVDLNADLKPFRK